MQVQSIRRSQSLVTDAGARSDVPDAGPTAPPSASVSKEVLINGVVLPGNAQLIEPGALREAIYTELLRQKAIQGGWLKESVSSLAPSLDEQQQAQIEQMIDREVVTPTPSLEECQRYYAANQSKFTVGRAMHLRHILFAVTAGVNVTALATRAEQTLLELMKKAADGDRFARLARELSNCPSGSEGGDLGWVSADDLSPELANELFHQAHGQANLGLHPRLIHSRYGFHLVEVLERSAGTLSDFQQVAERISFMLTLQSRARAWHQYMNLLIG